MGLFGSDDDETLSFSERWTAEPVEGVQQWEYALIDLREQSDGLLDDIGEPVGHGSGPSAEQLNKYGREGWELVETIEGATKGTSASKTNILVFKRPVEYREQEEKGAAATDK